MPADNKILSRSYLQHDLEPYLKKLGIDKTILVQAAPSIEETEYLLGIADSSAVVAGVVGWVNFEKANELKNKNS